MDLTSLVVALLVSRHAHPESLGTAAISSVTIAITTRKRKQ
jgi:hypothetical protein